MKYIVMAIILLMSSVMAEVSVKSEVEVSLPGEYWEGLWYENCVDVFSSFGGITFRSVLDTNVFYVPGADAASSDDDMNMTFFVLSSATHSLGEILRVELNHFQECGLLTMGKNTDGMIDTVTTIIDSVILTNPKGFLYEHRCYSNDDLGPCTTNLRFYSEGGQDNKIVSTESIEAEIARQNAALSAIPVKSRARIEKRWPYRAYDVKGRTPQNVHMRGRSPIRLFYK